MELLATQAELTYRTRLTERLAVFDAELPTQQLLWPSSNEDFAVRNVVFRFAAMAYVLSPATAVDDVEKFKPLAGARNAMFHGKDSGVVTKGLSVQCTELLKRFLGLVAQDDT